MAETRDALARYVAMTLSPTQFLTIICIGAAVAAAIIGYAEWPF